MNKILFTLLVLFFYQQLPAQLQSPESFLGYQPGFRYTPHWKIVSYVKHIAENAPSTVKLIEYGVSNEGRPLMAAFVSSSGNIANLENIRKNNLRLAGQSRDKAAADLNAPVIVWLSYNVHGNEPSSSEAALLALYALANPSDSRVAGWLKNTVVVIDPCLNPDGRERYVNWFTSVLGSEADPSPHAREHYEPWPGGRANHYYFDLNRDWAWQTQVESQQRLQLYNRWLPQVHVDYHEQSVNSPYYFAPAAEPYHEVISPWQRNFQMALGKKHAQYFDEKGWLYFTKEIFDLYYPSYGDTYPTFNGAIGVTYEQAGGSHGGLRVLTRDGDTLTLTDRILHHYTTSLSTVEAASEHAAALVKEFRKYFTDAITDGAGRYKSYVIKADSGRTGQIEALLQLLAKNNIEYGNGKTASGKGFSFASGKEEKFSVTTNDIVISAYQPRAALVSVLFEPNPKLSDSLTYDITAWALPYIYGLNTYASRERIPAAPYNGSRFVENMPDTAAYGYVIKWESTKHARVLAGLLARKIKVRFAGEPFQTGGVLFGRGTLIVVKTSNKLSGSALWGEVAAICNKNQVRMFPVKTGFVDKGNDFGSDKVRTVNMPRITLLAGETVNSTNAGAVWHFLDQELRYPVTLITADYLEAIKWSEMDILILPEGKYKFFSERQNVEQLKTWIKSGGKLIAIGAAGKQIAGLDVGLELRKPDDEKKEDEDNKQSPYGLIKPYSSRERDYLKNITSGSIFKIDLDNSHPLAFGYPDHYYTLKLDDVIYEYIKKDGWNIGTIKKAQEAAGFVGSRLKEQLKDGLLLGVVDMGEGEIVLMADDPVFRSFWENGKLLLANALFFVGN
ncbi:MAG: zinc carboxypeptidase [Chitinophagaceae bacterium]|nr:zinc carboxypeptidase [Chitinophagaceae bacterium]